MYKIIMTVALLAAGSVSAENLDYLECQVTAEQGQVYAEARDSGITLEKIGAFLRKNSGDPYVRQRSMRIAEAVYTRPEFMAATPDEIYSVMMESCAKYDSGTSKK